MIAMPKSEAAKAGKRHHEIDQRDRKEDGRPARVEFGRQWFSKDAKRVDDYIATSIA